MRRMLDPKEAGGTPRHGYRIIANGTFHYIVYTTKNYDFTIGDQPKLIADFKTNNDYAELRAVGYYEAAGLFKIGNSELVINYFKISGPDSYLVYGYNLATHEPTPSFVSPSS